MGSTAKTPLKAEHVIAALREARRRYLEDRDTGTMYYLIGLTDAALMMLPEHEAEFGAFRDLLASDILETEVFEGMKSERASHGLTTDRPARW